jgi:pimeloyl-ACP methyl ester carboxylesterase
MPVVAVDGIATHYEMAGSGPPILLFSPGGFDAKLANWAGHGIYQRLHLIEQLSLSYTCISFDRREAGTSAGRVERVTWGHYVAQGLGLLDLLGYDDAYLLGGCVGCSIAAALSAAAPERVRGQILFSPAGGAQYRINQAARFATHLAYVETVGLAGVVDLARSTSSSFSTDARVGPWVNVIRADEGFARDYAAHDQGRYSTTVSAMARVMFDRDSVPGVQPEDLLVCDVPTLVVPGQDASHATSAAHFLAECLPRSVYWDVPVADQRAENVGARLSQFLATGQ